MNAMERAEYIWDDLEGRRMGKTIKGIWVERLAQEIRSAVQQAEKEAWNSAIEACIAECDDGEFNESFRALRKEEKK